MWVLQRRETREEGRGVRGRGREEKDEEKGGTGEKGGRRGLGRGFSDCAVMPAVTIGAATPVNSSTKVPRAAVYCTEGHILCHGFHKTERGIIV